MWLFLACSGRGCLDKWFGEVLQLRLTMGYVLAISLRFDFVFCLGGRHEQIKNKYVSVTLLMNLI